MKTVEGGMIRPMNIWKLLTREISFALITRDVVLQNAKSVRS